VGICLPDEHNLLTGQAPEVRPLLPARGEGLPLHVTGYRTMLRKKDEEIVATEKDEEVGRARIQDTSAVVLYGPVSITTPLLTELGSRGIPVSYHSTGGWYQGTYAQAGGHNIFGRISQHRVAQDPAACLRIARSFVRSKILNCRVLLRRNAEELPDEVPARLKELAEQVDRMDSAESLLGLEGAAARLYFQHFRLMLQADLGFDFNGRNRRPPKDPVNCLLSFTYACLTRELESAIRTVGLDPGLGFFHAPRPGKPALALDLMEELRPVLCDSVVINAINNEVLKREDFDVHPIGCTMRQAGKKRLLEIWERRLDELTTHPTFQTRLSYRRILEVQTRLLGKVLLGDLPTYPELRIR
jgi:CRISPR-associated endonuclease Cas1